MGETKWEIKKLNLPPPPTKQNIYPYFAPDTPKTPKGIFRRDIFSCFDPNPKDFPKIWSA